ncbi:hypothetical protein LMG23992_01134 [Cupriavidus laharis]|uniref:Carbon monoxide dehydrogenase n=1 Tax=Cupriavidus laharis TaxID=151654 RepID=A0ABN7Y9H0_9BURK|nr:SRPBCC family protein [Cupriavidus laharis]CAG9168447.1 hypothetical protein LMG23992_01134 [Cupriavidus laharis]
MKVSLEKVFPMPADPDAAWRLLQDIEAVAGCMPGARITEKVDPTHYKGSIVVRIGPANLTFKGDIEVQSLDADTRTLHLTGKGADSSGTSAASMDLEASVRASGAASELVGRSEASVSGKAATFGGRMMNSVAEQILKQFAANFAARLQATPQAPAGVANGGVPDAAQVVPQPAAAPVPAPASELNGLALAWAIVRDWLRGLFSRHTA